jgi:hypothetical protein
MEQEVAGAAPALGHHFLPAWEQEVAEQVAAAEAQALRQRTARQARKVLQRHTVLLRRKEPQPVPPALPGAQRGCCSDRVPPLRWRR